MVRTFNFISINHKSLIAIHTPILYHDFVCAVLQSILVRLWRGFSHSYLRLSYDLLIDFTKALEWLKGGNALEISAHFIAPTKQMQTPGATTSNVIPELQMGIVGMDLDRGIKNFLAILKNRCQKEK